MYKSFSGLKNKYFEFPYKLCIYELSARNKSQLNKEESLCFSGSVFTFPQNVINEHFSGTQQTVSVDICSEEDLSVKTKILN